jgi:hypothetical protein
MSSEESYSILETLPLSSFPHFTRLILSGTSLSGNHQSVIPAQAGIQYLILDPRLIPRFNLGMGMTYREEPRYSWDHAVQRSQREGFREP